MQGAKFLFFGFLFTILVCSCGTVEQIKHITETDPKPEPYWETIFETIETKPDFDTKGIDAIAVIDCYSKSDNAMLKNASDRLNSFLVLQLSRDKSYRVIERDQKFLEERELMLDGLDIKSSMRVEKVIGAQVMVRWKLIPKVDNASEIDIVDIRFTKIATSTILCSELYSPGKEIGFCPGRNNHLNLKCYATDFAGKITPTKVQIEKRIRFRDDPKDGKVPAGYIGIVPAADGGSKGSGVLVRAVADDSPAANAGILPGDLIKSINDNKIYHDWKYRSIIANTPVGQKVHLELIRENKKVHLNVIVGKHVVDL